MLKRIHIAMLLAMSVCGTGLVAQTAQQLCPGENIKSPTPNNLACEISDATNLKFGSLPTSIASQLGQLPLATAVSGAGLTLNRSLGVFTASEDSLGTILTQRGGTIGKHKLMVAFTYQHFGFGSINGIRLKDIPTVQVLKYPTVNPAYATYSQGTSNIALSIDQFTTLASFGLTDRLDLTFILPFSRVNLNTTSTLKYYNYDVAGNNYTFVSQSHNQASMPGNAGGIGDVGLNLKANVYKGERTSMAVGGEVRFPTGDAANYLGSGAYGMKPYIVLSRHGRFTPNVNLAYQWNGNSILSSIQGNQSLPPSFLYSGGVDFRVTPKFTLVGEFLGQYVFDGPRLALTTTPIPNQPSAKNAVSSTQNYAMDNLGGGFKFSATRHLSVNASAQFKLDNAGLRSKIVPLGGASYRF